MEQTTNIKESVALGAGVILIGDCEEHIGQTNAVLEKDLNCIGHLADISLEASKRVRKVIKAGSFVTSTLSTNIEDLIIHCVSIEMTPENISYALGKDGESGITKNMIGEFSFIPDNVWLRLEAHFVYPNKQHRVTYIIPKVKVISSFGVSLMSVDDAVNSSIDFQAVSAIEEVPRNAVWKNFPMGKTVFVNLNEE